MASMTPGSSSSAVFSSTPVWKYDVFLSFSGEDTRKSFTDHLYSALERKGINTFRDDEKLQRGKTIAPELLEAIKASRFSIVIFSRNYASSTWCLDEVSKIAECRRLYGQTVYPIFYHVDPSEVRKQTGAYWEHFARHQQVFKDSSMEIKVNKWREALSEIASVSGWDLLDKHETVVINEIVKNILKILNDSSSNNVECMGLVGMDSRIGKMLSNLDIERSDAIRSVGIWGMGGIGKTTLAQVVLNKIEDQFEASCFVANIRERSQKHDDLCHLQEDLYKFLLESEIKIPFVDKGINILRDRLRGRKVLIILDDVDNISQIEALAGKGEHFGAKGSRIILTSRNKKLLNDFGVDVVYEVDGLSQKEALQLFYKKAFKNNDPEDELKNKAKEVVKYAKALPLALEVLGSHLFGRSEEEWSSALARLKENPNNEIINVLRVSYDGLQALEKKIFLDIAFFFKGENEYRVKKILENCDWHPVIGISVLIEKSLVKIIGGTIWMHDQIQELGWEIVRGESPEKPGERSRLSLYKDVRKVLEENEGTQAIEGIFLISPNTEEAHLNVDPFPQMSKLRLLKIFNVNFSGCIGYLSDELRLLEWHGYPLTSMPSSFKPHKLVELDMSNSCIKQLWKESKDMKNLTLINLSNCQFLTESPDFTMIPNLETLILKGCKALLEVHPSIGDLKNLILLNLAGCGCLKSLPQDIRLESIKTLILSGCSKLNKFPDIVGNMTQLSELYLDGTAIVELPMSTENLSGLTLLNLKDCKNFVSLPDVICSLTCLKTLMLSGCSRLDQLPENLGSLECLQELDATETAIRKVPSSIQLLKNLERLSFSGCSGHHVPVLQNRYSWESLLCCCLLPAEETNSYFTSLQLPISFSGLSSLRELDLSRCNLPEGEIRDDLGCLSLLEQLNLSENNFTSVPNISQLSSLRILSLNKCNNLQLLPNLPLSLKWVDARACPNLRNPNEHTIWASDKGLCLIDCQKKIFDEDEGLKLHRIPIPIEHVHEQLQKFMEDDIHQRKGFGYLFPYTRIPECFSDYLSEGSSTKIELPLVSNSTWMGFVLFIVYRSKRDENSDPTMSCNLVQGGTELSYRFESSEGPLEKSISIPALFRDGELYAICKYIPREEFAGQLVKVSHINVSVPSNCPETKVTMCGVYLLDEQNVANFVQNLFQPAEDIRIIKRHYHELKDHVTESTCIEEMSSIFTEQRIIDEIKLEQRERECTSAQPSQQEGDEFLTTSFIPLLIHVEPLTDQNIRTTACKNESTSPLRRQIHELLSTLFQGHHVRNFNFGCIFPLKAILPWFTYQCVGGSVFCCLPPMLFNDKNWVGFAVYGCLTWDPSYSLENMDPESAPVVIVHMQGHGSNDRIPAIFSLGRDCFTGSQQRLIIFHVPRIHFDSWELNGPMSAWLSTTIPDHLEIEMCGIRIAYEEDLKELVQTITECTLEAPDVHHQHYYQTFLNMKKRISHQAGNTSDHNAAEEEMPNALDFGYFTEQAGPTENGHDITAHLLREYYKRFHPQLTYNSCFPPSEIPEGFNHHSDDYLVNIQLRDDSFSESNWIGIALWASFSINEQTTSIVENQDSNIRHDLFCHLETDRGSVKPLHSYDTRTEKLEWLQRAGGFIWLCYIPRVWFSNQLNHCSFIEASFGSDIQGLWVHKCGLCFVYEQGDREFGPMILHCMKAFQEDWIQEILVKKYITRRNAAEEEMPNAHDLGCFTASEQVPEDPENSTSQQASPTENGHDITAHLLREYYKGFDPQLPYNSCFLPSEIPEGFNRHNDDYLVNIQLPNDSCSERNWIGIALWASFSINKQTISIVENQDSNIRHYLFCHFETDRGSVKPLYSYLTTTEELKWLQRKGGFIWLCYIPRVWFSNQLNHCSFVEASFGSESQGLWVHKCGLCFVYGQGDREFRPMILHCMKAFQEDSDVIQEILVKKDITEGSTRHLSPTNVMLNIMADNPLVQSHFSINKWKRNLENFLKKYFKVPIVIVLGLGGGIISILRGFEPNFHFNFCFPQKKIPEWFERQVSGPDLIFPLSSDFLDDSWLGFAICASFAVHENPTAIFNKNRSEIHVDLLCHFGFNEYCIRPPMFSIPKEEFKWKHIGGFIWFTYIPRWRVPDSFFSERKVAINIHSDCPGLEVQKCGIRLLYKRNLEEFELMIMQCFTSFYDDLDPIFDFLAEKKRNKSHPRKWETSTSNSNVEPQHERSREPTCDEENNGTNSSYVNSHQNPGTTTEQQNFDPGESSGTGSQHKQLNSGTCDQLDPFDRDLNYNLCFPETEILEWFRTSNEGPSVKIELPFNLSRDDNWIGLATCAYFSDLDAQRPTPTIDNVGTEESPHHLICHLQTDESGSLDHPHTYQTTNDEFEWLNHGDQFIWLSYIPRRWFSDQLNQCNSIEASFVSDSNRSLCVTKCGLRLVFKHDEFELKQTIEHCRNSLLKNNHEERFEWPNNDNNIKGKGKQVFDQPLQPPEANKDADLVL